MRYASIVENTVAEIRLVGDKRFVIHSGRKVYKPKEVDYLAAGWLPVIEPVVGDNQVLGGYIINADSVTQSVIDKTPEDVAAELAMHIQMMDMAARQYIDDKVHWTAGPMVFDKAKGNLPKSKAIKEWTEVLWNEFYTRVAMLEGGVPWDESMLDFSSVGPIPFTIKEAIQES